jgi:molecular chaperone DnaJ
MAKDFYATLGVPKTASQDEIKQAYRKLSKELHPDKHKGEKAAETRFKEVNEAYEALSDPEKRKRYDQFGEGGVNGNAGFGGGSGFGGFDFNSANMGGFGDLFESFFGGSRPQGNRDKGSDHEVQMEMTLKDVLNGVKVPITFDRLVLCTICTGNGAEPGTKTKTCETCGGTGQVTRLMNSLFGRIQQRTVCETCKGSGTIPEKPCHKCKGEGRVHERSTVTVDIPAGIEDGQTLRVRGQGDAGRRNAEAGDLFVHIRVPADRHFIRNGSDIHSTLALELLTVLLGGEVDVETLHGDVKLAIAEGTQPGAVLRIKGKGLPEVGRSKHGDHYVTVKVEIPKRLSRKERSLLEEWKGLKS